MKSLIFREFESEPVRHVFTLRSEGGATSDPEGEMVRLFNFLPKSFVYAQQPHDNKVARITREHCGKIMPGVDALITNDPMVTLVIRTADCGPIFIYDPDHHAAGLAHSGRRGTELDIMSHVVGAMVSQFVSKPENLIVVLGPCIRPPQYDVDFAATIRRQAIKAGVRKYHDSGYNTGSDLRQFYSYRMENGKTGRHYSAIALLEKRRY